MISPETLAALLPDTSAYVDTRGLLLSRPCEIFGQAPGSGDFVARAYAAELICVAGSPSAKAIRQAIKKSGPEVTVLCNRDNADVVAAVLSGWQQSAAILHELSPLAEIQSHSDCSGGFISPEQIEAIAPLAPDLAGELEREFAFTAIAAAFVDGQPVSFCFPALETESLWDVAIETLPAFRRRGYAAACFRFLQAHMQKEGKRPIWGGRSREHGFLAARPQIGVCAGR